MRVSHMSVRDSSTQTSLTLPRFHISRKLSDSWSQELNPGTQVWDVGIIVYILTSSPYSHLPHIYIQIFESLINSVGKQPFLFFFESLLAMIIKILYDKNHLKIKKM